LAWGLTLVGQAKVYPFVSYTSFKNFKGGFFWVMVDPLGHQYSIMAIK